MVEAATKDTQRAKRNTAGDEMVRNRLREKEREDQGEVHHVREKKGGKAKKRKKRQEKKRKKTKKASPSMTTTRHAAWSRQRCAAATCRARSCWDDRARAKDKKKTKKVKAENADQIGRRAVAPFMVFIN